VLFNFSWSVKAKVILQFHTDRVSIKLPSWLWYSFPLCFSHSLTRSFFESPDLPPITIFFPSSFLFRFHSYTAEQWKKKWNFFLTFIFNRCPYPISDLDTIKRCDLINETSWKGTSRTSQSQFSVDLLFVDVFFLLLLSMPSFWRSVKRVKIFAKR
jgi:hypothetical protein